MKVTALRQNEREEIPVRKRAIFTIVSANYIGFAATLMQSVREHHPEAARFIILSDAMQSFAGVDLAAELVSCEALGIERLDNMKFWYTVMEFNTSVKPYSFRYLMQEGYDDICYIDPDILLFSPLVEVFKALDDHSVVLTPHMMVPLQDGKEPSDLSIMKSGVYNLGFLAVRNIDDALGLINWWADRCYASCRVDIAGHMFTDQRWMDLAPVFVERPFILRHPGYNVAYWNLPHREVTRNGNGEWRVNGRELAFFHFSGIKVDDPEQFSKHQNRYTVENLGLVADLCAIYRERVLENRWAEFAKVPYAFSSFADGAPIDDHMRHWISRAISENALDPLARLSLTSAFFEAPEDFLAAHGIFITRFMYQYWLDRADLQTTFDVNTPQGAENYRNWFVQDAMVKQKIAPSHIEAARCLTAASAAAIASAHAPAEQARGIATPWPRLATQVWNGAARDAGQFLEGTVELDLDQRGAIILPRAAAMLWERRQDLRVHFPLQDSVNVKGFLNWVLSSGFREGALSAEDFGARFIEFFTAIDPLTDHYKDVPITTGMLLVRPPGKGQIHDRWTHFPLEAIGRLSHGLWFSMIAPAQFGWPLAIVAPVRNFFASAVEIEVDGLVFTRAMIALWDARVDVQANYPLNTPHDIWRYVRWLVLHGVREQGLKITDFHPHIVDFLQSPSPRVPQVTQLQEMLHDMRADLRERFDLSTEHGLQKFLSWCKADQKKVLTKFGLDTVIFPPPALPPAPVVVVAVVLSGLYATPSGRGEDLRGTALAFDEIGFSDYVIADVVNGTLYSPDGAALAAGTEVRARVNIVHMNADTAERDWRKLRRLGVEAQKVIGFWAWELDRLPSYWRHAFSFFDEIWASTRFAMAAYVAEDLRPVRLMPMVVSAPSSKGIMNRAALGLQDDETVFLFMFDFRSYLARKNPEAAIDAFCQAFPKGDEKVRLVIKTQGGEEMVDALAALRARACDVRIDIRDARLSREELLTLLNTMDAFVSLHRSEGFGRGPAEAMLLGKPVILTDYSGTADFANAECALLVDYTMKPVDPAEYPGVEGQSWADADVAMAARHMVWVAAHPVRAKQLGKKAKARIEALYSPALVGKAVLDALDL